ncbi:hypothetical protein OS493_006395 [Desmophyllum pertusum]|uniref:Uncharacterized protein n=1 Tax=Desmophyllum pertusum TaxID=174260 RepID=A0A9X0A4T7_9CNID|nr:hypothetical protein OS493_006395 [Desmophyllum pertusum]
MGLDVSDGLLCEPRSSIRNVQVVAVNDPFIDPRLHENPTTIPWGDNGADYVVESTRCFYYERQGWCALEGWCQESDHLRALGDAPYVVMGDDEDKYDGKTDVVIR